MEGAQKILKTKWLASFFVFVALFLLSDCSRFKKKEKKRSPLFQVYVPLEEDYPLLKRGLLSLIELSFRQPKVTIEEGLSDRYEIPPFDDWIARANPDYLLKLQIKAERSEDIPHILSFLNREDANFPFKVKIPTSEVAGSEYRGEVLFCRMQFDGRDILSRQVCKVLQQSLCFRELRPHAKRMGNLSPARCEMLLSTQESAESSRSSSKLFLLTGFPLPLRVKSDYPFSRFVEVDEALLLNLFGP